MPPRLRRPALLAPRVLSGSLAAACLLGAASGTMGGTPARIASVEVTAPAAAGSGSGPAPVRLPADEGPHRDLVEWWYFNGHLAGRDASGKLHSYGFEDVTFQFLAFGSTADYVANFAITDLDAKTFHFAVNEQLSPVRTTPGRFDLRIGSWSMTGGSGKDSLQAAMRRYSIDLQLATTEPAVLERPQGILSLGSFGWDDYYSWTSLSTTGTVVANGETIHVTGLSWMDHEWGIPNLASGAGWDWFSVQLSDGRQYMLQFFRNRTGKVAATAGTDVGPAGVTYLRSGSFAERATGSWRSPASGITYSSGWMLTVPGGHLDVTPDLADQELALKNGLEPSYWEGDCSISGVVDGKPVSGVGYTELDPPGHIGL